VLLIDYQYLQLVTACSHNPQGVIAAATLLAQGAKLFNVPTLVTTGLAKIQGLVHQVAAVFPDHTPLDRTTLNSFEDPRVVEWVKKTGKKKLVMGGLWTESCLLMASLSALHAGYEVYIVVDATSSGSLDSHNAAVRRMVQAGCIPIAADTYLKELQRDWSRTETAGRCGRFIPRKAPRTARLCVGSWISLSWARYSIGSSFRGQVTLYNHLRSHSQAGCDPHER
jgi:nicotinamidase-related amidase